MTIHMHERNIKKATVFSKQSAMIMISNYIINDLFCKTNFIRYIIRKHQDINSEIMQGIDQVIRIV